MLKDKLTFIAAAAQSRELLYVSFRDKETEENEESHSVFGGFQNGKGGIMKNNIQDWNTQAMCIVKQPVEKMITVSGDGQVFAYVKGQAGAEFIKPEPYDIRNLGVVDGYAYACGIDRQVYKRVAEGKWQPMHAHDSSNLKGTYGFEAIAGFSANDIYAAGWKGEIWHYDGAKWRQIDSPTNEILTTIVCAKDEVYIGGRNGTLLRGRGDVWTAINQGGYQGDFWGMQWFNGKLYVATMERICVLEGDCLVPVEMKGDAPDTCYCLTSAEGVMWSIGSQDIFSFDGKEWTRIE